MTKTDAGSRSSKLPVIAAVDGSSSSRAALAWAARYASLTDSPLTVMSIWHLPNFGTAIPIPDDWDPEADARETLEREVKEVLGDGPHPSVSLSVVNGVPATVLTDASKSASLLVLGSRGRGEFAGMLLGSVSQFVTTHARCPVVVVRGEPAGSPTP